MRKIKVEHITRVEGHGNLEAFINGNMSPEVRFSVVEAPRFFEELVKGQDYREVTSIASRICGICAVSHKCAALKGTEAAMNITPSHESQLLRRFAFHGEILSSHVLHIYFLAAPDFLDVPSIFPLLKKEASLVKRAVRLKELGYSMCDAAAGRHTHPVGMVVGGFTFVPGASLLESFNDRLQQGLEDMKDTIRLFSGFSFPDFERETEYVSLKHPRHYAFYEGDLYSSEGETVPVTLYREKISERIETHSNAKYARWHRPEYMVGALSRFNNNFDQLSPLAREAAEELDLKPGCFNPFKITLAQIVECVHCMEESLQLIDRLLNSYSGLSTSQPPAEPSAGRGVGAVEAPRGTLFHDYEYDRNGKCTGANMVIPTAQNLANLEADLQVWARSLAEADEPEISRRLEMLVRAYDPCISCATH